ncbi:MAG TPA: hypothetical protein VM406_03990 [Noviherbaspirillum sp.]|nr:hypothetical protein [Noviherbaspirillum sp.]
MKLRTSFLHSALLSAAVTLAATHAPAAFGHAGEDHGDAPAVAVSGQVLAPRTEARSEDVEMLAVYESGALTLYFADYRTNAPIAGAEVEIESGTSKAVAKAIGDGVYKADTPWIGGPGKHPLVVTIQGEQVTDLLEAGLDIAAPAAEIKENRIGKLGKLSVAGSIGGAAALGLVALGLRRRRK